MVFQPLLVSALIFKGHQILYLHKKFVLSVTIWAMYPEYKFHSISYSWESLKSDFLQSNSEKNAT